MGIARASLVLLTVLLLLPPTVQAQGKNEAVKFRTVDGVTIKGNFYPGENKDAPTVILLHNLNENRKKKNWLNLAEELQKKGYAVLTFDFRGHGDSKAIDPADFWSFKHPFNKLVPGYPKADEIDSKFDKRYVPALVNDIAAAKAFLDRKNDDKICNSSRIILIGAESGATLGALWLKSELQRYRALVNGFGKPIGADTRKPPEGSAVINCIWLSISPNLGSRTVDLTSLLYKAARGEKPVPMAFMYSKDDTAGKTIAKNLQNKLVVYTKQGGKLVPDSKYRFTGAVEIDGGKLKGQELLQKKTIEGICDYLNEASKDRGEDWTEREFRKTAYVWQNGKMILIAKPMDAANLIFSSYENFLR